MASQVYIEGSVASDPEVGETRKGRLMVKALIRTQLVREIRPGEHQSEEVLLSVTFFSGPAEVAKNLRIGDHVTIGAHLYSSEWTSPEGVIKRGIQLIADAITFPAPILTGRNSGKS
jgi:single-stranded DNA-binding protein